MVEHHFHFGIEHVAFIGLVAMLFRYVWKLIAARLGATEGPLGSLGVAMGGIAQ
jgi:hypothetical protein